MTKFRKTSIAVMSVAMAATVAASQVVAYANSGAMRGTSLQATETVRNIGFTDLTGSLDLSDIALSQLSDKTVDNGADIEERNITGAGNKTQTVIVSFNTPSLVEAKGDDMEVAEYLSTNAGKSALKNIEDAQNSFLSKLKASGTSYKLVDRYNTVMSGVAIEINTAQLSKIKNFANVALTGISKTYAAPKVEAAQTNPSNVYGTGIYNSLETMKTYGVDGSGISVAVLDTGLDYTHEAFSHIPEVQGLSKDTVESVFESLKAHGRNPSATIDDLYKSGKVPFTFDYADDDADVYPSYSQHGVHVSGIIAGKADTYTDKDGNTIDTTKPADEFTQYNYDGYDFLGAAPEAQIVVCKVFTDDLNSEDLGGATSEDIIAALDDCVTLGVDIINMSLGTACGFSSDVGDDDEGKELSRVYNSIKNAGISLITAAGNEYSSGSGSEYGTNLASNPDSGTVGSPSTFTGAMSVASINGQEAPYMIANEDEDNQYANAPIYYNDSNDSNAVPFDFAEEILGDKKSATLKYYVIPGYGAAGDYSDTVKTALRNKAEGEKILVLVRRGTSDFKTKVEIAHSMGADGIIVYNNVPGTIRMSLADIEETDRIPAISINMDAGAILTTNPDNPSRLRTSGTIRIDKNLKAGPFMNDYSSWGATPDLRLKPDITSHGGEITSTVSGGYEEMSGTSMATPNFAGFMALARSYFRTHSQELFGKDLTDKNSTNNTKLTTWLNQLAMSSATLVFDEEKLPYSPRKQGAGLATLSNMFSTKAYLYTTQEDAEAGDFDIEDGRPKVELGEDEAKKGEYTFTFRAKNFDKTKSLTFELISRFMTETISADGIAVAEAAYMLDDVPAQFTVSGATFADNKVTIAAGEEATITVKLTLSSAEKEYLNRNFKNGMYVEGFISLKSKDAEQCNLNLPFMGFYGDWESAPMLDYNAYEMSEIEQDTSVIEEEKTHESVFATQLYSTYYNGRYAVPMGGFAYVQDENAEQVYVEEEHCAISRFNIFTSPTDNTNYLTSTGVRALYAGLLRNAELVTYDLYDAYTGELIKAGRKYRVGKAYAGGGSARPALVDLREEDIDADNLPLYNNGKYRIEFNFYMKTEDEDTNVPYKNTFGSDFYVDFDAPILQSARVRYYDYEENNKTKQRVYLDLDVFDNHYPQSVLLCYSDEEYSTDSTEVAEINLATEYVTPIYNPGRNTTTTVSIEITDIYEKYQNNLYVQIDDYALNHTVQVLNFKDDSLLNTNSDFSIVANNRVKRTGSAPNYQYNLTLEKNEAYKVQLNCGDANPSNYIWKSDDDSIVKVKNGELFGLAVGKTTIEVTGGTALNGDTEKTIYLDVEVVDSSRRLSTPRLSFGVVKGTNQNLEIAQGVVNVNAGQTFTMDIITDPWYYPLENLTLLWTSSDENIAKIVTETDGVHIVTQNKHGSTIIRASVAASDGVTPTSTAASVTMRVAEPFDIANMTLNKYYGSETEVFIPKDKNVMTIGEEAFEDNKTMEIVHIPRTVTQISERAFLNATALREVIFDVEKPNDLSAINLILADAFQGCTSLTTLDLTNVKVLTVGDRAFKDCTNLTTIIGMEKIGIAQTSAFENTGLTNVDITGLHTAGYRVFANCNAITSVKTDHYSAISPAMFYGCTQLDSVTINNERVGGGARGFGAFENCTNLTSVTFGGEEIADKWSDTKFKIDAYAFAGCEKLGTVTFGGYEVSYIGDYAFAGTNITDFTMPKGNPKLGESIFDSQVGGGKVNITWPNNNTYENVGGAIYVGDTLIKAPDTITSEFSLREGTKAIGPYAFTDSQFDGVTTIDLKNIETLGEGAFAGAGITEITIPEKLKVIPASAFRQSKLTSIQIPATVTEIGDAAFSTCSALTGITFADQSQLKRIGDNAFQMCPIDEITLPDGVETMGNYVFLGCPKLATVVLPSVKSLGAYTFSECPELKSVTFGDHATDSGAYTCFPGADINQITGEVNEIYSNKLDTVNLGGLTEIKEGTFYACTELASIDLKNVTKIGDGAFASCTKLATVTNLDKVTDFGAISFAATADNSKITTLTLTAAKNIGAQAFVNSAATTIDLPAVENIGEQAFAGIKITSLNLPSTLKTYGAGAFMAATNLATLTLDGKGDGKNDNFFVKDNVLYRNVKNHRTNEITYELCLYPGAKSDVDYTVIDETSTIQSRSFYGINSTLKTVILPYSLKTIGVQAFTGSAITRYDFYSINAPALLSEYFYTELEESSFRSMYYDNFNDSFLSHFSGVNQNATPSTVTIGYPDNGIGYDNFVYGIYFGSTVSLGECMDDNTRALRDILDHFPSAEEVAGWVSWEITDENKAQVEAFSAEVINAHRMYNNIPTDKQRDYLNTGSARATKLTDIEKALRPVKQRFGIASKVASVAVSPSSTVRTEYVEGETFDITGLVLIITYDDYYTEELTDMTNVKIGSNYSGPLHTYNTRVVVTYSGINVNIGVTVTAADESGNGEQEGNAGGGGGCAGCSGCGSTDIGTTIGGTGLMLLTFVGALFLIQKSRRKANKN